MTESIYNQYTNKYYNPDDNDKKPGDNDNWKSLQKGFYQISHTQVETTEGWNSITDFATYLQLI